MAEGGLLEYLPDALIPFAGSRHRQSTRDHAGRQAPRCLVGSGRAGRQAMGERFRFESLRLTTRIDSPLGPAAAGGLSAGARQSESLAFAGAARRLHAHRDLLRHPGGPACGGSAGTRTAAERNRHSRIAPRMYDMGSECARLRWCGGEGTEHLGSRIPAALAGFWTVARRFLTGDAPVPPRKLK